MFQCIFNIKIPFQFNQNDLKYKCFYIFNTVRWRNKSINRVIQSKEKHTYYYSTSAMDDKTKQTFQNLQMILNMLLLTLNLQQVNEQSPGRVNQQDDYTNRVRIAFGLSERIPKST